ncbi:CopD family protein [Sessilibacter sp. MAH4]
MYGIVLLLHILAATIWVGGHIILSTIILPNALKERSPQILLSFEQKFEKIGMPALIVQILSGFYLAHRLVPNIGDWFNVSNPITHPIMLKLALLLSTILLALNARFRVIPNLTAKSLPTMAWHIRTVTLFAILFAATGVSFKTGWLY